MANADSLFASDRLRRIKDSWARVGVTAGGISVLITLVLIFFYLLYVIGPIFSSVTVKPSQQFSLPIQGQTAALGTDDNNQLAYRFSFEGTVDFVRLFQAEKTLTEQDRSASQQSHLVTTKSVITNPTAFAASLPRDQLFVYGDEQGQAMVVKPDFVTHFADGHKTVVPELLYPAGKQALQLAPVGEPLVKLAISGREGDAALVGKTQSGQFYAMVFWTHGLDSSQHQWQYNRYPIIGLPANVTDFDVTPDGKTLYALSGKELYVVKLTKQQAMIRQVVSVSDDKTIPVGMYLLSGAQSLLLVNSDNTVNQWFEVVKDGKRTLVHAREFEFSASPIYKLIPEYFRKGFYAIQQDGTVSAYFTSEHNIIYQQKLFTALPDFVAISPRANLLLTLNGEQWKSYSVDNLHPEIGLSSLWQKVWYEGYSEPDYVWQSTSASNEFEPKLSLVPIVFGTFKAAIYALFFAIPLALGGAIYTAYFMSSKMRRVVKPTIELMEALPTVILGFLAGIWLAPIVEKHLPGIVMILVLFPLTMLLVGLLWSILPGRWRHKIPNGMHIALLMPVIALLTYGCFAISPWIEQWLFHGDVRSYVTNELGIGYDQRNALVVGIAMGFAVIPTIFSIAEDAIFSVPKHLTNGSLALGATHWQTLTKVVLLTASPGIFSAVMMGLGRAVGETMIVLMATGNTPVMDWNILQGMRTLAATIAIEMPESEVGSSHYRVLFLAAFVLFVATFVFNTIAELVRQRLREKYRSL
ncbi:ABC transporter permease subunit [Photobacterium damselae]|uniref:ABC transporter permease subunit n=1 Tax=Photobacterium damselae TaxID=38293 RepID=UPI0015A2972B|nr:ABC transporter permease subunit [Photobacterium damselae]NVO60035.1 ABC transporter permease subunit [Photobacterium damselae subsp. damselae]